MQTIDNAKFLKSFCDTADNMYRLGWDERNGGNISMLLEEEEVREYLDVEKVIRRIPFMGVKDAKFDASALAGKIFLVTGTGKYFKNVKNDPENNLGIVRISADGKCAELLWGFKDGGRPTSEFPAHMMTHISRLAADKEHRVVMHSHPTNLLAMTYVHPLNAEEFSRTLWQMSTECIVVFPEGTEVLPWMLCGTDEIGAATAEKAKNARLVIWAMHGIYGTGKSLDETFGLIETAEKAAQIYILTAHLPRINTISDEQLKKLADFFGVTPRKGVLK